MEIRLNPALESLAPRIQNAITLKAMALRTVFMKHAGANIVNLASTHTPGIRFFHAEIDGISEVLQNPEHFIYIVNRAFAKMADLNEKAAFIDELYSALFALKETVSNKDARNSVLTPEILDQAIECIEGVEVTEGINLRRYREDTLGLGTQDRSEM